MTEPTLLQQARQYLKTARVWTCQEADAQQNAAIERLIEYVEQQQAAMSEPAQVPRGNISQEYSTQVSDAFTGWLDELQRLCQQATPAPWVYSELLASVAGRDGAPVCMLTSSQLDEAGDEQNPQAAADGEFLEVARDALPKLIAKVRELQGYLEAARPIVAMHRLRAGNAASFPAPGSLEPTVDDACDLPIDEEPEHG